MRDCLRANRTVAMPRRFRFHVGWSEIYQLQRGNLSPGDQRALGFLESQIAKHPYADRRGRRVLDDGRIVDDQTIAGMIVVWRILDALSVEMDRVFVESL
jgi:hypothetical protein